MRKTVGRFTSIMFALIMAITVIIVGGVEAHASDRYEVFLDDIIYIGQENELLLFDNKGSKEPEIISVTPSDKSVVGIKSKTVNGFKTYYAVGKKRGAAELVFKFKNGSGKHATYSQDVMVLPYPDWAKTLKVNGKSLNLKKNPYNISLKTGASKQKIQLVPEKGWSIDMIDANAYDGEGGYGVKQVKVTKSMLKSGKAFKFPANKKYLSVTVFLTKDCSFSIEDGDETYDYDGEQLISYCVTFTRPSTFKVKYDLNGGKGVVPIQTKSKGKSLKLSTKKPTRTGYDFAGWSTKKNGKVVYKPGATYKTDSDITLYAVWNWHAYYIKFEKNGGKGSQYYQACRYGKTFNLPACKYTRTGYTFAGWNTKKNGSGKSYADKASFKNLTAVDKKTVSLYAQWEAKKYKIKYSGVPEGSNNPNRKTYTVNTSTFKLKDASNEGYDFKGWYSDSKKTKKITSVKKGGTGTKTIYSKWTPHKYIIVFNANGGTGTMESMKSRKYGETYTLTSNAFKKKDYVFTGWNTSADGKGRAFKNGAAVKNLTPDHGGLVTMYAQWEPAYKKAMWFMDQMYITQVPGGDYSHAGTQNFDVIGVNSEGKNASHDIFAPFDCKIVAIHSSESMGNTVIIESIKKVRYADGTIDYMSMAFAHDNDISDLKVGQTIAQGKVFYQTGNYGNVTGIHSHVTCIRGKYKDDYWTQNAQGNWSSPEGINPTTALFISKKTKIINDANLEFKVAD